jgi:hypothetical protein
MQTPTQKLCKAVQAQQTARNKLRMAQVKVHIAWLHAYGSPAQVANAKKRFGHLTAPTTHQLRALNRVCATHAQRQGIAAPALRW